MFNGPTLSLLPLPLALLLLLLALLLLLLLLLQRPHLLRVLPVRQHVACCWAEGAQHLLVKVVTRMRYIYVCNSGIMQGV
jgi:hypothetical protein